ncbi:hypothetical protein NUW58_g7793 [Xylaria curta]|uniref:Uncharacterized protein n=1 Tax=Xylaria curta TaxID=42375 RepID=A0ACC1NFW4_9PEZI|nr:hypothetical protein NUW58_g7793 [Xylaria curta]
MCNGWKAEMLCGHIEKHFNSPCGKKCSSPKGPTRKLDKLCPRCNPEEAKKKRAARTAELITQFGHKENEAEVQKLTDRAGELNLSMRRGIRDARNIISGNISGNTRSSSDPSSDDSMYITADGKHVIEKQYTLIGGHWAHVTYRRELDEVDPLILLKLQEKRENQLAKERKRKEKKKAKNGESSTSHSRNSHGSPKIPAAVKDAENVKGKGKAAEMAKTIPGFDSPSPSRRGSGLRKTVVAGEQVKRETPGKSEGSINDSLKTHYDKPKAMREWSELWKNRRTQEISREHEPEPAETESSTDAVRPGLKRTELFARVESCDEDTEDESGGSSTKVDTHVKQDTSTNHGKGKEESAIPRNDKYLDIWQKISDEDDKGRRPPRYTRTPVPNRR